MSKKLKTEAKLERIDRSRVPDLLVRKYMKDYEACLVDFPDTKKIDLLEHLLDCLDIFERYVANPTDENYKVYSDKEYGSRLQTYYHKKIYLYYGDDQALIEKEIYTVEEWNNLGKMQKLSPEEFARFIPACRRVLYLERQFLLLYLPPEDEKNTDKTAKENLTGLNILKSSGKVKREAHDKRTSLSQEQTALLMYYLQQEKVFLKGDYLTDKDMGVAFEILTGYSQNTLRQSIGKFTKNLSHENLKEIQRLLKSLTKIVDTALIT
jgi:hypothetical protein